MYIRELERIKTSFFSTAMGIRKESTYYIYKHEKEFGVALENIHEIKIDEAFSNVSLYNKTINVGERTLNLLILSSNLESHKNEFASFCMHFIEGTQRELILTNPLTWWKKWKELIGNRLHNPKPYDIIAELYTLLLLYKKGLKKIVWKGPTGSTVDITTSDAYYEVKSSLVRYENEVTVSSQFQLNIKDKPTNLIFFKMEEMERGVSINMLMDKLIEESIVDEVQFKNIEEKLGRKGYRKNASIRNKEYVIHEIRCYEVDDNFPKINEESFKDGKYPANIKKIKYTINLDNIKYELWER